MTTSPEEIPARIQRATSELIELEHTLKGTKPEVDSRVLYEFRQAVDNIRHTGKVVQEWISRENQQGDVYGLLPLLTADRIRRAAQINKDLALDLDASELTSETEGIEELFRFVEDLFKRLAPIFKRGEQSG